MSDSNQDPNGTEPSDDSSAAPAPSAGGRKPLGAGKPLVRKLKKDGASAEAAPVSETPAEAAPAPAPAAAPAKAAKPKKAAAAAVAAPAADTATAPTPTPAANAVAAGASKAKTAGIAGVIAFAVFSIGGVIYMKKTDTGALATQVMGSSSAKAAAALGEAPCRDTNEKVTPLVVDWESEDRSDVEIAMKKGLAVVQYSCDGFKVLADCTLEGKYGYNSVTLKEDVVSIANSDELKANLPKSGTGKAGLALSNEMARGMSLDIATAMVGKYRSTRISAKKSDLKGVCEGATHYIRAASVGAFALDTNSTGKVKAAAEMFGQSNNVSSSASKLKKTRDGAIDACRKSSPQSPTAPDQCQAMVRLELVPIEGTAKTPTAAASGGASLSKLASVERAAAGDVGGCPKGMVYSNDHCVVATEKTVFQCNPKDGIECMVQCQKGDENSCLYAGLLLSDGDPSFPDDYKKALDAFKKSCDNGNQTGCAWLGYALAYGAIGAKQDISQGIELLKKSADAGNPLGVSKYAGLYLDHDGKHLPSEAGLPPSDAKTYTSLKLRACNAGSAEACGTISALYEEGSDGYPQDDAKRVEYLKLACEGGDQSSCLDPIIDMIDGTKTIPKNAREAQKMLESKCAEGSTYACGNLARQQLKVGGPLAGDRKAALNKLIDLCEHSDMGFCADAAYELSGLEASPGISKDPERARILISKPCESVWLGGGSYACYLMGQFFERGIGGPKDTAKADEMYEKSCFWGNTDGCNAYFNAHRSKK